MGKGGTGRQPQCPSGKSEGGGGSQGKESDGDVFADAWLTARHLKLLNVTDKKLSLSTLRWWGHPHWMLPEEGRERDRKIIFWSRRDL